MGRVAGVDCDRVANHVESQRGSKKKSQGQTTMTSEERNGRGRRSLLPKLLLHRRCRGGKIGKEKLTERFQNFWASRWDGLLAASIAHDEEASLLASRKRRTQNHNDLEHRVNRAMTRIQLGELSAGRMVLEGADLAPGTEATLTQLRRRPARPQDPLPPEIAHFEPASLFSLDKDKFAANLRSSRRGTAGGPSGMTNEHLRPLLDNPRELHLFFRVAELLARGQVPENVASVLRKGRMTTLQKPGGGVRGIVAGDVVRWNDFNSWQRLSRVLQHRSSTHCPPEQDASAWRTHYRR